MLMRAFRDGLLAGLLCGLTLPVLAHDPDVKDPNVVHTPDLEQLPTSTGSLLMGLSDKCLDVQGGNDADGTFINLFTCHGQANQRWELVAADSFFELRGLSGKCAQPGGGQTERRLNLGPCGGLEDRWNPEPNALEDFTLVHVSSGFCMDVQAANDADGTPVNIFPCHGEENQTWRFGQAPPSGRVDEQEPNNSFGAAQFLEPGSFVRTYDPDVGDTTHNTSVGIPHASVYGTGDGTYDYYSFEVQKAGDVGIFDVDYATVDTYLTLYNSQGLILRTNDDSATSWGADGSFSTLDAYTSYTFGSPGLYVIRVSQCCFNQVLSNGATYRLQVSVGEETSTLLNQDRFAVAVDWQTAEATAASPGRPTCGPTTRASSTSSIPTI